MKERKKKGTSDIQHPPLKTYSPRQNYILSWTKKGDIRQPPLKTYSPHQNWQKVYCRMTKFPTSHTKGTKYLYLVIGDRVSWDWRRVDWAEIPSASSADNSSAFWTKECDDMSKTNKRARKRKNKQEQAKEQLNKSKNKWTKEPEKDEMSKWARENGLTKVQVKHSMYTRTGQMNKKERDYEYIVYDAWPIKKSIYRVNYQRAIL